MRLHLLLPSVAVLAQVVSAAPLQLHNRIVFERSDGVWTMNAAGKDQKRVWRVPKGYGQFGGFSWDGKWALSFNRFNVYRHNLKTRRLQRVIVWSNGWGTNIQQPSFSSDGKQILCEIGDAGANWSDTYVVRVQADKSYNFIGNPYPSALKPIGEAVPTNNLWSSPRWSSDAKQLVVVGGPSYSYISTVFPEAQSEIWLMNADGTQAQRITNNPAWDFAPCLSPNGQTIAFIRRLDTDHSDVGFYSYNLWTINIRDHSEKQLTANAETYIDMLSKDLTVTLGTPLFSPDGKRILFNESSSQLNGHYSSGIYQIDVDGANHKRLSDGALRQWIP